MNKSFFSLESPFYTTVQQLISFCINTKILNRPQCNAATRSCIVSEVQLTRFLTLKSFSSVITVAVYLKYYRDPFSVSKHYDVWGQNLAAGRNAP